MTAPMKHSRPDVMQVSRSLIPTTREDVNAAETTTVEIESIDNTGAARHLYYGAMHSLADALSIVAAHAAAPVNRWVRKRLEDDDGGRVQIGQISAAICVLR